MTPPPRRTVVVVRRVGPCAWVKLNGAGWCRVGAGEVVAVMGTGGGKVRVVWLAGREGG